jgi:hypothetical protein
VPVAIVVVIVVGLAVVALAGVPEQVLEELAVVVEVQAPPWMAKRVEAS